MEPLLVGGETLKYNVHDYAQKIEVIMNNIIILVCNKSVEKII